MEQDKMPCHATVPFRALIPLLLSDPDPSNFYAKQGNMSNLLKISSS
jgi:hypothetical protein